MKSEERPSIDEIAAEFIRTQTLYLENELKRLEMEKEIHERQIQILNGIDCLPKPSYMVENPYACKKKPSCWKKRSLFDRIKKRLGGV